MRKALVAGVLLGVFATTQAEASHAERYASDMKVTRLDPKDVANRLDLKKVAFKGRGDGSATLTLQTRRRWGCGYINRDAIRDGGVASIRWSVNTNRDPYTEREAYFSCNQGVWKLHWTRDHDRVYNFPASRIGSRGLAVRLPLRKLGLDQRKHLSFRAFTFANGKFGEHVYLEETDVSQALKPLVGS